MRKYDLQINPWQVVEQNFPQGRDDAHKLAFLLRYAILAPSSHNTQPWKFAIGRDEIALFVNKDRWLRVADSNQRELYNSIGCALENLLIAAEHFGYGHHVTYFPEPTNLKFAAAVEFLPEGAPSAHRPRALFDAISNRHTNHRPFEDRLVPEADMDRLRAAVAEDGISLYLTSDLALRLQVDRLVNRADATLFANREFREELDYWIGEGAFGTPWLLTKLAQLGAGYLDLGGFAPKSSSEIMMSAPVLGLLCSTQDDLLSQVKAGQALERIYLTATCLGIRLQPMSQLVEVAETRDQLRALVDVGDLVIQQPLRLGYAEPEPSHTPRRIVEEVMV